MFNNQRFAAAATAVALGACAVIAPQAQGATVGTNDSGSCHIQLNDQEQQEYERVAFASTKFNQDDNWRQAFEVAFPAAGDIAAEFQDAYENGGRESFNNNLMDNLNAWTDRISAETGVSHDASFWYFSHLWNSLAVSTEPDIALVKFWDDVHDSLDAGTITASERGAASESAFRPVAPLAVLEQERKAQFPELSPEHAAAWTDAFVESEALTEYRKGAAFESVFEQARQECAEGGDAIVLFPTDGPNPDEHRAAEKTDQGADVLPSAEQNPLTTEQVEQTDQPEHENGTTTTVVRENGKTTVNVSVTSHTKSRSASAPADAQNKKDDEPKVDKAAAAGKRISIDSGIIAAIVLALLAAIGGAAFSFLG
ncbi:hypothetical protein FPH17_09405 [Corynebacterium godavarianum]|uniref:Secreted protein n=1 Tax=Corynebacterium godavarianum TaxID=2054421 RepID=A0ABY3DZS7_9CORY|nr:hypothetical protein [Corynebacterium godavarianum]MBL7284663.1 hypothetical protein [Corynebacterium godavarianum]TSJ72852.1 hypothetical protein FPH17_09405 [Corynebacterium godavarianum]